MMKYAKTLKEVLLKGLCFYALSTLVLGIQFLWTIVGSAVLESMDGLTWLFFIASCFSHAATVALIPLLLFFLFSLVVGLLPRSWRAAGWKIVGGVYVVLAALLSMGVYLDMLVYRIYRFHINGIVLRMFFGKGGNEVFNFSFWIYLRVALVVIALFAFYYVLWRHCRLAKLRILLPIFVLVTVYTHCYHIYAIYQNELTVQKCSRLLPYFFPTRANNLLHDMGFKPNVKQAQLNIDQQGKGDICYPLHPLTVDLDSANHYNVVLILVDSWNKRAFTEETMPNLCRYAQDNWRFDSHWACGNGTGSSVFGLFFSLSCYYWDVFDPNQVSPLLIDQLLAEGYEFTNYPSAQQYDPPFARVLFHRIKDVRVTTEAKTTLGRDQKITDDFIESLPQKKASGKPFFSFVFYDLPHSFELPKDSLYHFQPSWEYVNYLDLNNNTDPIPFWNLYRNTCWQVDLQLNRIFAALKDQQMDDNTVVIISGDHGQEFNENKKNYWGHASNYSDAQIAVPLVVHMPKQGPQVFKHRTTHYDIVPTLMHDCLGVQNPTEDYSMGYLLTDTRSRTWHILGSELNYAFITEEGVILEKKAEGSLDITDAQLNPLPNYQLDAYKMKETLERMNKFFR